METVADFIFLGSKTTADGDCSHEIKRRLLLGRKVMMNLDSILKSRDITLPTKFTQAVMYGYESWTIKKAERWRIDGFELWCWRRLLRVPWTVRRWNQSILKEISPEYSLEGLMLKLKLQYFGHLMRRTVIERDPDAWKDWRQEEKRATEDEMVGWHHQKLVMDSEASCAAVHSVTKSRTRLSNWTELNYTIRAKGLDVLRRFLEERAKAVVWKTREGELECLVWK